MKTKSIIEPENFVKTKNGRTSGICYLCYIKDRDESIKYALQNHHIFDGPNRMLSDRDGLTVHLCSRHHASGSRDDVHNPGSNNYMQELQQIGQEYWENKYVIDNPDYSKGDARQAFMKRYGKNYL